MKTDLQPRCGIYKIVNKDNGKYYVGRTLNLDKRWYQHKKLLIKNKHFNKYLQSVWNKYGPDKFEFIIVEYVNDKNELINIEQKYINVFIDERKNGLNNCYNLSESSISPMDINKGRKHSDKTKKILSDKNKGKIPWNKNKSLKLPHEYTSRICKKKYNSNNSNKSNKHTSELRSLTSKECLNRPEVLLKFKQPRKPPVTAKNVTTNEIKTLGRRQWHDVYQIDYRKLLKGYTSKGWKMVDRAGLEPATEEL
jgi:group I intron endonuclease